MVSIRASIAISKNSQIKIVPVMNIEEILLSYNILPVDIGNDAKDIGALALDVNAIFGVIGKVRFRTGPVYFGRRSKCSLFCSIEHSINHDIPEIKS